MATGRTDVSPKNNLRQSNQRPDVISVSTRYHRGQRRKAWATAPFNGTKGEGSALKIDSIGLVLGSIALHALV